MHLARLKKTNKQKLEEAFLKSFDLEVDTPLLFVFIVNNYIATYTQMQEVLVRQLFLRYIFTLLKERTIYNEKLVVFDITLLSLRMTKIMLSLSYFISFYLLSYPLRQCFSECDSYIYYMALTDT